MNPKNWITARARYPAGGDPVWQADNLAGQLLRDEFFGAAPAGVSATITGAQAAASAGNLVASGAVDRTITGAQATVSAGTLAAVTGFNQALTGVQAAASAGALVPSGGLVVAINGAQATALAGTLAAGDVAPPIAPSWPAGGGRHIPRRALVRDLFIPGEEYKPPVSIPAVAAMPSAQAMAWAGWAYAQGGHAATATFYGAKASAAAEMPSVKGGASIVLPSTAANRAPAVVCLGSAAAQTSRAEVKATGLGISDEEILALLIAA